MSTEVPRFITHITTKAAWNADAEQPYTAPSLQTEGYIHASTIEEAVNTARRYYTNVNTSQPEAEQTLLLLLVDTVALDEKSKVVLEAAYPPSEATKGKLFPHIYGPINRDAVVVVGEPFGESTGPKAQFPSVPESIAKEVEAGGNDEAGNNNVILLLTVGKTAKDSLATGANAYTTESLATEGFIHASTVETILKVANLFFTGITDPDLHVFLNCVDKRRVSAETKFEKPADAHGIDAGPLTGYAFPHVYGAIEVSALSTEAPLERLVVPNTRKFEGLPANVSEFLERK